MASTTSIDPALLYAQRQRGSAMSPSVPDAFVNQDGSSSLEVTCNIIFKIHQSLLYRFSLHYKFFVALYVFVYFDCMINVTNFVT